MRKLPWLLVGALIIGLASMSQAGRRVSAPATITVNPHDPTLWHCSAGLGNTRAQTGNLAEAGCTIDPAPSGNVITCWVQDATGDRRECIAVDGQWVQTLSALNSDSMIEFDVQTPSTTDGGASTTTTGTTSPGDCLSLTIENSSAYQPKAQ